MNAQSMPRLVADLKREVEELRAHIARRMGNFNEMQQRLLALEAKMLGMEQALEKANARPKRGRPPKSSTHETRSD